MHDQHQLWLTPLTNEAVAERLDEAAELLESQHANPFRVKAYRSGAQTLRGLNQPVSDLLASAVETAGAFDAPDAARLVGPAGLVVPPHEVESAKVAEATEIAEAALRELPGIGHSLARAIEQLVHTGRWPLLERLRGENAPERIFTTVADIGPVLARRVHELLDIEDLSELQAAAWDGRLESVPGFGRKRIQAVRDSLAGRLRRPAGARPVGGRVGAVGARVGAVGRKVGADERQGDQQLVQELLGVDARYRRLAEQDRLPRVAPRRFNPNREAWLPILHTHRDGRHYTAMYSNTPRAHEFGKTHDWVVIYRDDETGHGQWTVITATFGPHKGQRIVRGLSMDRDDS